MENAVLHATAMPVLDARGHLARHELAAMTYLAGYSGQTRRNYASHLKMFFTWCAQVGLDPLTAKRPHLELFLRHCETDLGNHPATVSHKRGVIRGYYDMAHEDGILDKNPAVRVKAPRFFHDETRIVGLSRTELGSLIQTARAGTASEEALVIVMAMLGLRVGEATRIRIEDFGDEERSHTVLRVLGKGNKAATIPLPPPVLRSMRRAQGDRTSGVLILRDSNGQPFTGDSARRRIAVLARRAGITKRVHPHMLRHSFVTAGLDAGVPLRDMQVAARHEDPRTTTRYDRARLNLDRHAAYTVSSYLTGGA
jgi:integrase/recombinase XerD